jgi:hypothetical protein
MRNQTRELWLASPWRGPARWLLALALPVALAAALTSAAAYLDSAHLNAEFHGTSTFSTFHYVIAHNGTVYRSERTALPADPGDDLLLPGHAITKHITVANNSPALAGTARLTLESAAIDGQPSMAGYLRFTVVDGDGNVLLGDKDNPGRGADPWNASFNLGRLNPRGSDSLQDGEAWVPGAPGSHIDLDITIYLLDDRQLNSLQQGWALLRLKTEAESA